MNPPAHSKKILAIIPARGGSKGLPRKNVKMLAGKPLIVHTIQAVNESGVLEKIMVCTEDEEISQISTAHGAKVLKLPTDLTQDHSTIIEVIFHALEVLKKEAYVPDVIVLLQPTSPLKTAQDIQNALDIFLKSDCQSLVSVYVNPHPHQYLLEMKDVYLVPLFGREHFFKQRQNLDQAYMPNGAIYISWLKDFEKYRSFYSDKIMPYVMPYERSVDIDTEVDFNLAEIVMKKK